MYRKKECVAMLLAGGQGSRLYVLTKNVAKPAVPFGGKYRIIDFPLSNCINSGIDTVGVLTQYEPHVLNAYIGSGQTWDLDRLRGGVYVLPPYQKGKTSEWYKGTANAIYQNISFIDDYDPEYVLILSGDHIYKMNYNKMLQQHKETGADATIAVLDVPLSEASRFGIMNCKPDGTIYEFEEKPKQPKSTLASMGIYIFSYKKLRQYLIDDENNPKSSNDFGKDIIPAMLANGEKLVSYRFEGYWKDVGTIESLWEANMDLLAPNSSGLNMADDSWKIYGRTTGSPPHFTAKGASVTLRVRAVLGRQDRQERQGGVFHPDAGRGGRGGRDRPLFDHRIQRRHRQGRDRRRQPGRVRCGQMGRRRCGRGRAHRLRRYAGSQGNGRRRPAGRKVRGRTPS